MSTIETMNKDSSTPASPMSELKAEVDDYALWLAHSGGRTMLACGKNEILQELATRINNYETLKDDSYKCGFEHGVNSVPSVIEELAAENAVLREALQRYAKGMLAVRDQLVKGDQEEAYHQLTITADPELGYDHWKELERLALLNSKH